MRSLKCKCLLHVVVAYQCISYVEICIIPTVLELVIYIVFCNYISNKGSNKILVISKIPNAKCEYLRLLDYSLQATYTVYSGTNSIND